MADVLALAQSLYDLAAEDPAEAADLKASYKTLLVAVRDGTQTGTVTHGSKNGASYTMTRDFSLSDRLTGMKWAIRALEKGVRPTRITRVSVR